MGSKLDLVASAVLAGAATLSMAAPAAAAERDVAAFGALCDGRTDDTAALGRAFAALDRGDVLTFPRDATCLISGRIPVDDKVGYTVVGNDATLEVAAGTPKDRGPFVHLVGGDDVLWLDLTVDGNRDNRPCPARESGDQQGSYHNIGIYGVRDVAFERVRSVGSCMDGFYLAAADPADPATFPADVRFVDVLALRNRRQGLSIINARDVLVQGGSYSFTEGDWPQSGIDLEPNPGTASPGISGVTIRGATFEGNAGFGVVVANVGTVTDVVVEDNLIRGNEGGAFAANGVDVTFRRNLIEDHPSLREGARSFSELVDGADIDIVGNSWRNIDSHAPILVIFSYHLGTGVDVVGNCFTDVGEPVIVNHNDDPVTVRDNRFDLPGGCSDPRQRRLTGGGRGQTFGPRDPAG